MSQFLVFFFFVTDFEEEKFNSPTTDFDEKFEIPLKTISSQTPKMPITQISLSPFQGSPIKKKKKASLFDWGTVRKSLVIPASVAATLSNYPSRAQWDKKKKNFFFRK